MTSLDKPKVESISIDDASDSNNMGLNMYLISTALVAAMAAFNVGLNIAVANIPEKTIRQCPEPYKINGFDSCVNADEVTWGTVIAMFALGGGFGSLIAGRVLDIIGRRRSIMVNNLFFIIGGVLIATTNSLVQMGIGRFVVGFASGLATASVSTYIGEISPVKGRGALGSVLQLMIVIGILAIQLIGIPLNSVERWRYLFAFTVIPAVIQTVLIFFCVESPRYLISKNNLEDARKAFIKLRRGYNIDNEFNSIVQNQKGAVNKDDIGVPDNEPTGTAQAFKILFNDPVQFKYLIITLILHAVQQLSGINGVILYSTSIFENTFGKEEATYATVGVGGLNLVITIISLFVIDRVGRKFLLISSLLGMGLMSALIVIGSIYGIDYLVIASVLLFVGSFAFGLGAIPWLFVSEIFPTRTVSAASALCMGVNWFCNFAISFIFPKLLLVTKEYTFVIFAVITIVSAGFVFVFIPETKGRTVEEILAS